MLRRESDKNPQLNIPLIDRCNNKGVNGTLQLETMEFSPFAGGGSIADSDIGAMPEKPKAEEPHPAAEPEGAKPDDE